MNSKIKNNNNTKQNVEEKERKICLSEMIGEKNKRKT